MENILTTAFTHIDEFDEQENVDRDMDRFTLELNDIEPHLIEASLIK